MKIESSQTAFSGYQHPLKSLFKRGLMPSVTHGLYGKPITPSSVSLEHLLAHSCGGKTTYDNLALAHRDPNMARGSRPLANFLTWEMLEDYLRQFNFRIQGLFDGFLYQNQIRRTCERLGVRSRENPLKHLPKKLARSLRNKARKGGEVPAWAKGFLPESKLEQAELPLVFPEVAKPKMEQLEFPFMKDLNLWG